RQPPSSTLFPYTTLFRSQHLLGSDASQPNHERDADAERKRNEEPPLPPARLRENAEGGPGVLEVHDVENRQQLDGIAQLHGVDDERFRRLIDDHDEEREPQPVARPARRRKPNLRDGAHVTSTFSPPPVH